MSWTPAGRREAEAHAAMPARIAGRNWPRVRLTLDALSTLREEEVPRRIAFVSDKVFEPRWWQTVLSPSFAAALRDGGGDSGARFRAAGRRRDWTIRH